MSWSCLNIAKIQRVVIATILRLSDLTFPITRGRQSLNASQIISRRSGTLGLLDPLLEIIPTFNARGHDVTGDTRLKEVCLRVSFFLSI